MGRIGKEEGLDELGDTWCYLVSSFLMLFF